MKRFYRFVTTVLLFSSFFASGANSQDKITLGLTTRAGSTSLPFVIAEEMGFFKGEGLNALVVIMQNQVVVNGVVTRNVDYGGTFSNFVGAAISGLPVRIVMSAMDGSDHYLVTSANIKRVEDLKGKVFGISSFGGTPHSEAVMILRKYGMNPEKDVTFLQIGGSSSRYGALESGSIHAAMLVPPFNTSIVKGYNALTGSKVKLGSWDEYLAMRAGVLRINEQCRSLLSNDLGAVAGLLFDVGSGRYPAPPCEHDSAALDAWRADLDRISESWTSARLS